jgi:hypothetical protein
MFTVGACFLVALLVWLAKRTNEKDRQDYERNAPDDLSRWLLMLHIRQDLRVMAFLLGGIMVLLGILADLHR